VATGRCRSFHSLFHKCPGAKIPQKPGPIADQITKNKGFFELYPRVTATTIFPTALYRSRPAQQPHRQHKNRTDQSENAVNGDSQDAQRQ
jgi:hypothetical protein